MTITYSVTPNLDGTHTFGWDVFKTAEEEQLLAEEKKVLHNMELGIIADPIVDENGVFVATNSRGVMSWSHDNPYNGDPEYSGSKTFNISEWYPGWTTLGIRASICTFTDPENPISDQYGCNDAAPMMIHSLVAAASAGTKGKGKGRKA